MIRWPFYSGPYEREFRRAARATRRLGYDSCTGAYTTRRWLGSAGAAKAGAVIQDVLGHFTPGAVAHQCLTISQILKNALEPALDVELTLTLGDIELEGRRVYGFRATQLRSLLGINVPAPRTLAFHAWLTLPSMEIVDATFATSMAMAQDRPKLRGLLLLQHADQLRGMRYHPVATGEALTHDLAGGWYAMPVE